MVLTARRAASVACVPWVQYGVNLQLREIRRERRQGTRVAAGPPELEGEIAAFGVAKLSKALP